MSRERNVVRIIILFKYYNIRRISRTRRDKNFLDSIFERSPVEKIDKRERKGGRHSFERIRALGKNLMKFNERVLKDVSAILAGSVLCKDAKDFKRIIILSIRSYILERAVISLTKLFLFLPTFLFRGLLRSFPKIFTHLHLEK